MSVSLEQPMREAEIDLVELANANEAAIAQEVQDRISADTTLQSNIDAEESARIAADTTLQSNIDAEESARIAADTTLQSNIDAEASAREAADTTLQSNIDAEASAREAADTTIGDRVTTVEGHFPVATANIADGAVTTIKLNDGIQNQLSFLASVPELEFGTSNSFNVQGSSYADVDVTFTTKTKEPIVLCGLQHATGNLNCIVTAVTNQQFSVRVYNLTTTDVSDVTLDWLTISER